MPDNTLIDHVACGSAHTMAWSSVRRKVICTLPMSIPLEFNHLQNISLYMLKNRLVLLHHFSNIFCKSLPLFNLSQLRMTSDGTLDSSLDLDHLRCVIFSSAKVSTLSLSKLYCTCLYVLTLIMNYTVTPLENSKPYRKLGMKELNAFL